MLLRSLKSLVTLHVDRISIKPYPDDNSLLDVPAPSLEVLSIGTTARQDRCPVHYHRTGDFLLCLCSPDLLPALRTLYIQQRTACLAYFLHHFSDQLQELGFAVTASWVAQDPEGHLVEQCPSLERVLCIAPEGPVWEDVFPIPSHESMHTVDIMYINTRPPSMSLTGRVVVELLRPMVKDGGAVRDVYLEAPASTINWGSLNAFAAVKSSLHEVGISVHTPSR